MQKKNLIKYVLPIVMITIGSFFVGSTKAVSNAVAIKKAGGGCVFCKTITTCTSSPMTCAARGTCTGTQFVNSGVTSRKSCRAGGTTTSCSVSNYKVCGKKYRCILWVAGCGKDLTGTNVSVYTSCTQS